MCTVMGLARDALSSFKRPQLRKRGRRGGDVFVDVDSLSDRPAVINV